MSKIKSILDIYDSEFTSVEEMSFLMSYNDNEYNYVFCNEEIDVSNIITAICICESLKGNNIVVVNERFSSISIHHKINEVNKENKLTGLIRYYHSEENIPNGLNYQVLISSKSSFSNINSPHACKISFVENTNENTNITISIMKGMKLWYLNE